MNKESGLILTKQFFWRFAFLTLLKRGSNVVVIFKFFFVQLISADSTGNRASLKHIFKIYIS